MADPTPAYGSEAGRVPSRIQRKRTAGWRMPDSAVYVGRPTVWGNPFAYKTFTGLARVPAVDGSAWEYEGRISADGAQHDFHHTDGRVTRHNVRWMTRAECVEVFRRALVTPTRDLRLWNRAGRSAMTPGLVREQLAGRDLACWCPLDQPCHADVLLVVANGLETTPRPDSEPSA